MDPDTDTRRPPPGDAGAGGLSVHPALLVPQRAVPGPLPLCLHRLALAGGGSPRACVLVSQSVTPVVNQSIDPASAVRSRVTGVGRTLLPFKGLDTPLERVAGAQTYLVHLLSR
jgi:hypothetical protein